MKPRPILPCASEAAAAALDALICAHLRQVDGNQGSRWSGVQIKDDGTHAIVWDPQLEKIWPALLAKNATLPKTPLATVTPETIDPATKVSNWKEVPIAEAKADQASEPLTSTDEHLLSGK